MSVFVRSLVNRAQTLNSVALPAFALQERGEVTPELEAAATAKTINLWVAGGDAPKLQSLDEYTPLTTEVVSLRDSAQVVSILPAGTIAAMTLNMPANPQDGQRVNIAFSQVITALTQQVASGSGHTLRGALTAATANGFGTWQYRATGKVWMRVG